MILLCNHYFRNFAIGMAALAFIQIPHIYFVKRQNSSLLYLYIYYNQYNQNFACRMVGSLVGCCNGTTEPMIWCHRTMQKFYTLYWYNFYLLITYNLIYMFLYSLFSHFLQVPCHGSYITPHILSPPKPKHSIHYVVIISETWSIIFTCGTWWGWPSWHQYFFPKHPFIYFWSSQIMTKFAPPTQFVF